MEPSVSIEKKKQLNSIGRRLLRKAGITIEENNDYDWIRKSTLAGYAHIFIQNCWDDSIKRNEADESVFRKIVLFRKIPLFRELVDIDLELGTSASQQLFWCLCWTTRLEIIKVGMFFFGLKFNIPLGY